MTVVRHAVRALLKRPGTTALAILALGLGIGLTTTMFGIINGVVLRGLPFDRPERIMALGAYDTRRPEPPRPGTLAVSDYLVLRGTQGSFADVAASSSAIRGDLVGPEGVPLRHRAAALSPNALSVLGAAALLGRGLTEDDARPGAGRVVLIGEAVWTSQFMRDPGVIGRVIRANGAPTTIVGVMPASFGFPRHEQIWFPLELPAVVDRSSQDAPMVEAFGRLRDGVGVDEANAELATIAAALEAAHPANQHRGLVAQDYLERWGPPGRTIALFWTMLTAVFGVLLIACVNVANLQLARAAERRREVAIRMALGAHRGRVIRELLVEGLMLSSAGALLGLVIAQLGVALIWRGINDPTTPFWIRFDLDARVFLFALGLTAFATMGSSLVPALRATRAAPVDALKDDARGTTGFRVGRLSRGLVVAQVALSFALLMGSGLVVRSLVNTSVLRAPFRMDVLTGRLDLSAPTYRNDQDLRRALDDIRRQLSLIPGASAVTFANHVPGLTMEVVDIEGRALPAPPARPPGAEILAASADYAEVMQVPLIRGRSLRASDGAGSELVALVDEEFAARHLPNEDPIGRRFRIGRGRAGATPPPWRTIVGIVPRFGNLSQNPREHNATAIVPFDQRPTRSVTVFVAGIGDTVVTPERVRRAVAEIDDAIVVDRLNTVRDTYDQRLWPYRVFGGLFSAFGMAALFLASAGLYGVMAFAVRRRSAEIGIRMALGAGQSRIQFMVLRQGLIMVGIGLAIGTGIGALLASQMTMLLYDVHPWDGSVFTTALAVLVAAGTAASFLPARRAASVDPLVALRSE